MAHFVKLAKQRFPATEVEAMCSSAGLPKRISPFADYPIVPLTIFEEALAQRLYPGVDVAKGMGRLGHEAFHAFASSVAGRVVTALVVFDARHISTLIEKSYRMLNNLGTVSARLTSPKGFVVEFRNYLQYPEHQHGILEEGCIHLKWAVRPELTVWSFRRSGPGCVIANFDITMHE